MDSGQGYKYFLADNCIMFNVLNNHFTERWQILLAAGDFETSYVLYEEKKQNGT